MMSLSRCVPVLVLTVFALADTATPAQSPSAPILPELTETNVRNLMIPFEIHSDGGVDPIKEVELLVSQDKGRHWHVVSRLPVAAKKFVYNAPDDGEYWFTFRTVSVSGNVSVTPSVPQLRAAVNTLMPMPKKTVEKPREKPREKPEAKPERQGEASPITPPKPEKFRSGVRKTEMPPVPEQTAAELMTPEQPQKTPDNTAQDNTAQGKPAQGKPAQQVAARQLPSFPGWEAVSDQNKQDKLPDDKLPAHTLSDDKLLDDILSDMDSFFDIQPARNTVSPNGKSASAKSVLPSFPPSGLAADTEAKPKTRPAGKIADISLKTNSSRPQVVVQWGQGDDTIWRDAQIDVLRGTDKEGPWLPISMNLPNTGEYWWFATQEDMKPFFLTLRIRSVHGGTQMDTTASAITIKPEDMLRRQ